MSYAGPGLARWNRVGSATIGAVGVRSARSPQAPGEGAAARSERAAPRARGARRCARSRSLLIAAPARSALADAVVTLVWQEPFSALYATLRQDHLSGDAAAASNAPRPRLPSAARSRASPTSAGASRFSRASCERHAGDGSAVGRIVIPRIGASFVMVNGTRHRRPQERSRHLPGNQLPGRRRHDRDRRAPHDLPGSLPPHRRTAARQRHPSWRCPTPSSPTRSSASASSNPPTYRPRSRTVGYSRLVLSACTPLFSAAKRLLVLRAGWCAPCPRGAARSLPGGAAAAADRSAPRRRRPPARRTYHRCSNPSIRTSSPPSSESAAPRGPVERPRPPS